MTQYKTIVTGHGNFAKGLEDAILLLAGKQKNIVFINFTKDMSEKDLSKNIEEELKGEPVLIFTDLIGGTPYKESIKLAVNNNNIRVVTGCNLASLLEACFTEYENINQYAEKLVENSKKTTQKYQLSVVNESDDDF